MTKAALTFDLPPEIDELADQADFDGSTTLAQAGRIAMARHVRKLYKHLPGARSGDDPHDVHQARVATRRLRASLTATSAAYDQQAVRDLNKQLRKLARVLGDVRDRDVLLMRLRKDAEAVAPNDEVLHAIERLETERTAAHADLVDELGRKRTTRLLRDLGEFLVASPDQIDGDNDDLPLLVRHYAGSAVWHEYEAVWRFETVMPDAGSESLHDLRIACKHLRYTLELFEPALGADAASVIASVTQMQEQLGDIHDADVAIAYLGGGEQPGDPTTSDPSDGNGVAELDAQPTGIAAYIYQRRAERTNQRDEIVGLWRTLSSVTFRRKIGKMIAGL